MVEFRAPSSLHKGLDSLESALRCLIVITSDFFGQPEPMPFRKVITFCYSWVCFQGTALSFKSRDTVCGFGNNISSALVKVTGQAFLKAPTEARQRTALCFAQWWPDVCCHCLWPPRLCHRTESLISISESAAEFLLVTCRGHRHRDRDGGSWDRLLGSPACHA